MAKPVALHSITLGYTLAPTTDLPVPTNLSTSPWTNSSYDKNYDENSTDFPMYYDDQATNSDVSYYIQVIGVPIIIAIGILCNALSLAVFLHTRMRSQSCSVYLAYLNIVDTGFLLGLLPAWLGFVNIDIFHTQGVCQITIFSTYVFAFLSVWTVVAFTVERFIVVYHPFQKPQMCTKTRAVKVVCGLTLGATVLYSYIFWTAGIMEVEYFGETHRSCTFKPQYEKGVYIMSIIVELVVTFIIPSAAIIVLNGSIMCKIIRFYKDNISDPVSEVVVQTVVTGTKEPLKTPSQSSSSNKSSDNVCGSSIKSGSTRNFNIATRMQQSSSRKRQRYQLKTTRALLLISSTFLLLNLPSYILRLYILFETSNGSNTPIIIFKLQEFAQFLYYMNFACNMFLYVAFSRSFRCGFLSLLKEAKRRIRKALANRCSAGAWPMPKCMCPCRRRSAPKSSVIFELGRNDALLEAEPQVQTKKRTFRKQFTL